MGSLNWSLVFWNWFSGLIKFKEPSEIKETGRPEVKETGSPWHGVESYVHQYLQKLVVVVVWFFLKILGVGVY